MRILEGVGEKGGGHFQQRGAEGFEAPPKIA